jgi:16S rRNA (cytidine1402-2'-O)-methyltransferase
VATPIGNLRDITLRAVDALKDADVIACEDTRHTAKLLHAHGISTSMTPYHDHNADRARPILLERMRRGAVVALVSDAGTPLVADPGFKLVRACLADGIDVTAAPGPSAVLAALILSGLPTDRFLFAGFLPSRSVGRRKTLRELNDVKATLVLFESPQRIAAALADLAEILGPRDAAVVREMTKMHEEVRRGTLADLAAAFAGEAAPKGEIVIIVGPPAAGLMTSDADLDATILDALTHQSLRDASAMIAAATGRPRRDIYARALALSAARGGSRPATR